MQNIKIGILLHSCTVWQFLLDSTILVVQLTLKMFAEIIAKRSEMFMKINYFYFFVME